jgi:hypothetical protein
MRLALVARHTSIRVARSAGRIGVAAAVLTNVTPPFDGLLADISF